MLQITISTGPEGWDEAKEEFIEAEQQTILLEHSLISLSKWESKWRKSFLSHPDKTDEEILDYIKCMTITPNVKPEVYNGITNEHMRLINDYISAPMTATCFSEKEQKGRLNNEIVTSELVYYWMIALNIPFECQKWHLNRLLTLIRVCNIKNQPPKKMSKSAVKSRNAALNAKRRQQLNSKG